jgi:membrane-bound lytic murein transglycosylase B
VPVGSLRAVDSSKAAGTVIAVERCEYVTADLLLRLSVRVPFELPSARPLLLVEREAVEHSYTPLLSCAARAPLKDAEEWMWRGAFAVPPDLACDPHALFALRLRDEVLFALPAPSERAFCTPQPRKGEESARTWPYAVRRGALLFVVTCQLCVAPGWSSAGALADGSLGARPGGEPAPEKPALPSGGPCEPAHEVPSPPSGGPGEPARQGPSPPSGGPCEPSPPAGGPAQPAPETPSQPPGGGSGEPAGETPPKEGGAGQSSTTTSTTPAPSSTSTAPQAATPAPADAAAPAVVLERRQKTTAARKVAAGKASKVAAAHAHRDRGGVNTSMGGAPAVANNVAPAPGVVAAEAGALAAELASSAASAQALGFYRIPLFLLPIYRAAAVQYGVPWQILAAINEIETDYGSDLSVSSVGAVGWMQFMPATWIQYGVDALNAGYADPYNPVDAIFAAARYLHAAGAASDLRAAILAYNHSEAYASSVLLRAKLISSYPKSAIATLTGLVDARLPVTGKQVAWKMLAPAASPSSATAGATLLPSKTAANGSAPATPGSSAPPSPAAVAAAATGTGGAAARAPQMVDLLSARNAAVVAVQDGRILRLGSSRKLGKYVVLRDVYGDVLTYAGLGSIAPSDAPPKALPTPVKPPVAGASETRSHRANHALPLRVGSVVAKGTVLGHVRVPLGAQDGHLHFAIRPAGDPKTIDPRPILANWRQLNAALHPQGATGESSLLGAGASLKASVAKVAHSTGAGGTTPSPLVLSGELTATQWDQLIARIAVLPAPKVAVKPSFAAIPDPQTSANNRGSGKSPLSSGG